MTITVYTKPACVQCKATFRALDKNNIDYTVVDLTEDPEAYDYVKSLGFLQAPVVITDTAAWAGFKPDNIAAIAAAAA